MIIGYKSGCSALYRFKALDVTRSIGILYSAGKLEVMSHKCEVHLLFYVLCAPPEVPADKP